MMLDLSVLSKFIELIPFQMIIIRKVRQVHPLCSWMINIGLQVVYWHVSIAKSLGKYLGFQVDHVS